jgi:hypothetical protein
MASLWPVAGMVTSKIPDRLSDMPRNSRLESICNIHVQIHLMGRNVPRDYAPAKSTKEHIGALLFGILWGAFFVLSLFISCHIGLTCPLQVPT